MYDLDGLTEAYDLDLPAVIARLKERTPTPALVGLQFPDGLRHYGPAIAAHVERETGVPTVISGEPSFGACDLALDLARIGVDCLVHFGHSPMPSMGRIKEFVILFAPVRSRAPVEAIVTEAAGQIPGARIGILTTAQHAHKVPDMARALEAAGKVPVVGFGDNRVFNPGQLLGCNFTAARTIQPDVDAFLYVGTGDFHPIAAAWGTDTPVWVADPQTGEVRHVDHRVDALMKERFTNIARAMDARRFAVLVGTRVGQERYKLARGLKKLIERHGREATVVALDYFSPDALASFRHLDAWVNTGCPRITTDDYARYDRPMLTPQELEIVLGVRSADDYVFDEFKGTKPRPHADPAVGATVIEEEDGVRRGV